MASLQWGPWAGAGMAAQGSGVVARLLRLGLHTTRPHAGLAALGDECRLQLEHAAHSSSLLTHAVRLAGSALRAVQPSQMVAHIDWRQALRPRQQRLYFFSDLMQPKSRMHKQSQPAVASLPAAHAALDPEVRPSKFLASCGARPVLTTRMRRLC